MSLRILFADTGKIWESQMDNTIENTSFLVYYF